MPSVAWLIVVFAGLIAIPTLTVSLVARVVAHRRLAVVQLVSVLLVGVIAAYLISLEASQYGISHEQWVLVYSQVFPLAAALLALYVVARVRDLSTRAPPSNSRWTKR